MEIYTSFRNENEARNAAEAAEGLAAEEGLNVEVEHQDEPGIRVTDVPGGVSTPRPRRAVSDEPDGQATA